MRGNENLAVKEYRESKDKARFVSIAQKLAQHINNLAEDKNTRIRWIWQLIQNAKDVPNQFDKCKMRIEIRENKFIFAHNGDPFRVSDLQSIVAQYSSKPEQNKTHTQTTGKYGTGFITTYILSRKVRIKGLLTVKTPQEQQQARKQKDEDDSDGDVQMVGESEINKTKKTKLDKIANTSKKAYSFDQFSEEEDLNLESQIYSQEEAEQQRPSKAVNFEGGSLYQRFEVFLDREYKDRDTQFYYKLMRTQHNLIDQLQKNDPQPKWQRKQGQLNTQFVYQQLDQAAFKMIQEGMNCLKELFPYALLFNPKLSQIQMIDKRKGKRLRNFGIKRIQQNKIHNLRIFNASILQQGKDNSIFSLAYLQDEDTQSVVTMPLKMEGNTIKLLELNHKMPKMFKEFPLIGCKDTEFNFVFTSQLFYPNQSRSDLLLKEIQGRNSKKSRSNWQSLEMIFKKAQLLYKNLAHIATQGLQNLLILTLQNQFTSEQFKDKNFKAIYGQFLQEISDIKCIDFKNQRRGALRDILSPFGKSLNKKIQQDQYAKKMNSVFSLLLGQGYVLADDQYQKFYPKLIQHRKTWDGLIKYKELKDCLKILQSLTFEQLTYKSGNKQNALNFLESIYQFLQQNNPEFVTQGKLKSGNEEKSNYVLTNNLQFKDLKLDSLMKKIKVPDAYCEVAKLVGIDINQNLIYDRFTKFFEKTLEFNVGTILDKFQKFFFRIGNNEEKSVPRLIKLGRLLSTFNIQSKIFEVASRVNSLSNMCTPYKLNDVQSELSMTKQMAQDFRMLLQYGTLAYLNDQISDKMSLTKMIYFLNIKNNDKNQAIEWLNHVYEIQQILLPYKSKIFEKIGKKQQKANLFDVADPKSIIWFGLAMNENFYYIKWMNVFTYVLNQKCFQGQYPDEDDLEFYSKMRQIYNKKNAKSESPVFALPVLEQRILHPQIKHKYPVITTFKEKFLFTVDLYEDLNKTQKIFYINYLDNSIRKAKQDQRLKFKIEIFSSIMERMYYDYASQTKCIKKTEDRQFMFYLLKHPEDISYARQIHETMGLREGIKKLKLEDANKKKEKGNQSSNTSLFK